MNKLIKLFGKVTLLFGFLWMFNSCSKDPNSAGYEYMPDMYRSPAVEPYVDYGELRGRIQKSVSNKMSVKTPPKYTIPYFGTNKEEVMLMLPYHRKPSSTSAVTHGLVEWDFSTNPQGDYDYQMAAADMNPIKITAENAEIILKKGKDLYSVNCKHCHGEKGDGQGSMVVSGAYVGVPNFVDKIALSDGQMFYSIYYGKGAMGSHAPILNKKEIWNVVHYIRSIQNPEYGKTNFMSTSVTTIVADSTKTTVK
ncbi:MAG: cytochrome c [Flavobacteriia bacterium]|nr:cytochrome c [Flavobacteriia bacterium]